MGLYVPLRLFVFSDYHDRKYIEYDKPSSLLAQFCDELIIAVCKMLDQKFGELAEAAVTGLA